MIYRISFRCFLIMKIFLKLKRFLSNPLPYFSYYKFFLYRWLSLLCVTLRYRFQSLKIKEKNVSLLCHDCTGGVLLHTVCMRFNAPTVNMYFDDLYEYCLYLKYLEDFTKITLEEYNNPNVQFPCGVLKHPVHGDVHLYFNHDKSFAEAADKWENRSKRINFAKLSVLLVLKKPDVTLLEKFEELPYHKAVITFPDVYSEIVPFCKRTKMQIHSLEYTGPREIGEFLRPVGFSQKRPIENFDIIKFLNF